MPLSLKTTDLLCVYTPQCRPIYRNKASSTADFSVAAAYTTRSSVSVSLRLGQTGSSAG